ncbi:MAG: 3-phosphoshikimate 1-carboxyvinyltransferase [Ignavibacteria bacterium]|nr:3-phosphoshikimate 1-carboxyvinyltransferase [Ignavibacteria bacterium]
MHTIQQLSRLRGEITLKGDKSISHRAVIFAAMAQGVSTIRNCSGGADVRSTIDMFRAMGTTITQDNDLLTIAGRGYKKLRAPEVYLNAGNSGTTARLMAGVLVNQEFSSVVYGDLSLSKRPMERVTNPLREMGAMISLTDEKYLPMYITPAKALSPISHLLQVASAQVKSAILLSGLFQDGVTTIKEHEQTRNHTEKMLGLPVVEKGERRIIKVSKDYYPVAQEYIIPGDISSAAFYIALALLIPGSELTLRNVSLNPTRTAFLQVVELMGAKPEIVNAQEINGELRGDIIIRHAVLKNIEIPAVLIPNLIDEVPVLAILGSRSEGHFSIRHAKELRVKESDRINAMVTNLRACGISTEMYEDGFEFEGMQDVIPCPTFQSFDDHRIAMAFSVLSFLLKDGGKIDNLECIKISNPDFFNDLNKISG